MHENERSGDDRASLLAYHAAEAVRPEDADLVWGADPGELERRREEAVRWLRRAAALARGRSEFDDVVDLLSRAAELCDDAHEQALIWRDVGLAHALRFDGDAFWSAMERALGGPLETEERAEIYGTLAFQTSNRSGMWGVRAVPELVSEWAARALELAPDESKARVQALLARGNIAPSEYAADAREAAELAERVGDVELRSYAHQIQVSVAIEARRFDEAAALTERRLALLPQIDDPDHILDVYESAIPVVSTLARIDEARRLASQHAALSPSLSPHHRIHSVAVQCEVDDSAGDWHAILDRTEEIVAAVDANLETPCTRNARSLMLVAVAHEAAGKNPQPFEERADELGGKGWAAPALASPALRLALLRRDSAEVERQLRSEMFRIFVYGPGVVTARLDGLAALRLREEAETFAGELVQPGTLLEPFALRTLGIVRNDDDLVGRADELFAALGLEWHRAQTDALVSGL
jgi:hypothetical protein